ncbi:helix-turn-helix domain-containing protein [Gluconobacter morbifer]|uniref:HTH cro/C1-type domain-containing protein n=1 Tax=Gluconobacter morbifer G707 TaxID=1088869 RepID=G6XG47_9PROT|nr:helix-turn-helix domain-containing protein [Gluconobacter morbifer]EHH69154.1 hypothetical protein GMO_04620 [Gluconobacter morbifer G707]
MTETFRFGVGQIWSPVDAAETFREIVTIQAEVLHFRVGNHQEIMTATEVTFGAWIRQTNAVLKKEAAPPATLSPGLELGRRIRLLREMVGFSQQQLADKVGISRSAVAFWETGRSGHVGKHLGTLAKVLGVEPEVLLTGMAYKAIQATLTPDEHTFLNLYRQLDPLIKLQAQKWIERRVRQKDEAMASIAPKSPKEKAG